jgi:hypothetical protein
MSGGGAAPILDRIARFREALTRAGFTADGLRPLVAGGSNELRAAARAGRIRHLVKGAGDFEALVRRFVLGEPVDTVVPAADLEALGIARGVWLGPAGRWLLAGTTPVLGQPASPHDSLINFAVRRRSRSTLVLGAGAGRLAFEAVAWSDAVTALDPDHPRQAEIVNLNAALNNVPWLTAHSGPEPFDHILHGGHPLDVAAARALAASMRERLAEGGFLQMCCRWPSGESAAEWLPVAGYDTWILHERTQSEQAEEPVRRGLIALRRRAASNWVQGDKAPAAGLDAPYGNAVLDRFAAEDFLAAHPHLAGIALRGSPGAAVFQETEWTPDGWRRAACRIRLSSPLPWDAPVDQALMGLLSHCDGRHPLGDVLNAMAAHLGADPARVAERALPIVVDLVRKGFLLPV